MPRNATQIQVHISNTEEELTSGTQEWKLLQAIYAKIGKFLFQNLSSALHYNTISVILHFKFVIVYLFLKYILRSYQALAYRR